MAGNLFDVFVVGSADPSAAGETRLAAALSAKHGLPLATVAKAISAKNLRAGQGLDQAQAQSLVRHLQSIGAVTVIRPASTARTQNHAPASTQPARAPIPQPSPAPPSVLNRPKVATPAPGSGWPGASVALTSDSAPASANLQLGAAGGGTFGMPALAPTSSNDPFAPVLPGLTSAPAQPAGQDPFQPRRSVTPVIATAARPRQAGTPSPRSQAQPSGSGLALDISPPQKIELARGDRAASEEEVPAVRNRTSPSAGSLHDLGMGESSGVAMDEDPKNLNLVRCVQHGLYYDKTKASGCRKCMSTAREAANKMEAQAVGVHLGDFRRKPAKRAFLGLAFALVLGFLPAVYYCFGPGTTEVRRLRVEQELLSRQAGTEEIMRRFDELDVQVGEAHDRSTRNTSIVWVAVAGVAMLGWYKIT
ncbi:MAG TPA: hypothetical protein VF550_00075 [Polyangia bacterium]